MPSCPKHRTTWGDPFAPCPDCELDTLRSAKAVPDKVLDATNVLMAQARERNAVEKANQAQRSVASMGQGVSTTAPDAQAGLFTRYVSCGLCRIHVDTWLKTMERYDPFTDARLCEDCWQKRYVHKAEPMPAKAKVFLGGGTMRVGTQPVGASVEQDRRVALPTHNADRKALPVFDGLLMYFPLACAEVARVSKVGNDQHNPGEPMHWAREKSTDQMNTAVRHLMDDGMGHHRDTDGTYHLAKAAWRTLAQLELLLEQGA